MKRIFVRAALIALIASAPATAVFSQDGDKNKDKEKQKLKEYDEIIIRQKKSDKDGKMVIEIKDGRVTVNGKDIEEYDDDNFSVKKLSPTRYRMSTSPSPFRGSQGGAWNLEGDLNEEETAYLGVTTEQVDKGVRIQSVAENSAAAKAGLKKDDIITKVNSKAIVTPSDLANVVTSYKPNEKVTISYIRDNKTGSASATLVKRNVSTYGLNNMHTPDVQSFNFKFDELQELNRTYSYAGRQRLGIRAQDTEDGKGVKVLDVDDESAAEKAGIKEDDIITEFDGKPITSTDDLVKASKDAKDKNSMKVKLNRDGKTQSLEIKIPKKLKTANL